MLGLHCCGCFICGERGLLSSCDTQASHCRGSSCCGAQTLGCAGFNSCLVSPQHVGCSQIRDPTCVSYLGRWILYHWATREAPNFWIIVLSEYMPRSGTAGLCGNSDFSFLRDLYTVFHSVDCFPLHQPTFPPTVEEGSLVSTPSPAFVVCTVFNDGHPDWCDENDTHCSFLFYFVLFFILFYF